MLFGGYNFYLKNKNVIKYEAELSFLVNSDEQSSNMFGGLLGQIGIGGAANKGTPSQKILKIAQSRKITEKVLFQEIEINGTKQLIGNYIIALYQYFNDEKDTTLFQYKFKKFSDNDFAYNSALKYLHKKIVQDESSIVTINYDEDYDLFNIYTATPDEVFSIILAEAYFNVLSLEYEKITTEKQYIMVQTLERKKDSVYSALSGKENYSAQLADKKGIILFQDRLPQQRTQRDLMVLGAMYQELVKNYEAASFNLENKMPVFQALDYPIRPLSKIGRGRLMATIKGAVIGGLIMVLLLVIFKMYLEFKGRNYQRLKQILKEENIN